ncbi:MAG: hypothetical protein H3C50_00575 [Kiritimatiellae bacterium]|nr:hypothetical protein [Kiritimatiellia bacterium]
MTGPVVNKARRGVFLRSLVCWLLLYAVLLTIYNGTYHLTREVLIGKVQVAPASFLLSWTLPGVDIRYDATSIQTPALVLQILRGCDGVEVWAMLVAAMLVFPMPWRCRWQGLAWGTLLLLVANLVRIVSLFHIALARMDWFDIAHGVIWQGVMVLLTGAFVLGWTNPRRVSAEREAFS